VSHYRGMGMDTLWELWKRDLGICQICFRFADIRDCNVDHVVPRSAGGTDDADNLQLAHSTCNSERGDEGFTDRKPHYLYNKQHGKCVWCDTKLDKRKYDKVRWDKTKPGTPDNMRAMHKDCRVAFNKQFDGLDQRGLKELCST